jgi:hypothetical protein
MQIRLVFVFLVKILSLFLKVFQSFVSQFCLVNKLARSTLVYSTTLVKHLQLIRLSGAPYYPAENIRLGLRCLPESNALAYLKKFYNAGGSRVYLQKFIRFNSLCNEKPKVKH